MSKPTVFISYSHLDEEWKDRLVRHLLVSQIQGHLELWHDGLIGGGEDWEQQIQEAMNAARVAILLVSANSLTSDFILREEVRRLLDRRASEGLRIFPIIIKPCDWGAVDWLRRMNLRPKDGKPLSGGSDHEVDLALAEIAREIRELLKRTAPPVTPTFVPLNPNEISTSRLPRLLTPYLFGREGELQLLDKAWDDPHRNIVTFIAWGGIGKSALVSHWLMRLEQENYRGAERVYAWSFYSQGTSDRTATAEYFTDNALRWFGGDALADQLATASPWEKGERLAKLVRQTRTLLILDGLEPVQHPPGPQEGRLKEQSLQALLRELAAQQPGLCVITTREAVGDLTQYEGRTVVRHDLTNLSPQAGAQLLRELKVKGAQEELEAASDEYGGHSLALTLLGSYLGDVYTGDVLRRHEIESLEEDVRHGWQVTKMMRAYEKWLGDRQELAMLDVLRLLGLFDRPADAASVAALRAAPAIPGLTESLTGLDERRWRQTLSALLRIRLLAEATYTSSSTLDAHPLVREYFRVQLKSERPDAWCGGNLRLYEHLTRTTNDLPDTLDNMAPLYATMTHGCEAGRHQQVLEEIYWRRIDREGEAFSTKKLGAFGADLAALTGFFACQWHTPLPTLSEDAQSFLLSKVGFVLKGLGRLQEAVQPTELGLEAEIAGRRWQNAAIVAGELSGLFLTLGDLHQSLKIAQQSVELADRSGDLFQRMVNQAILANLLHQIGRLTEATEMFRSAEALQQKDQPKCLFLYSVRGFQYCDLLLSQEQFQEVQTRAIRMLDEKPPQYSLLDIALDQLSLGRAWLLQAALLGIQPVKSPTPSIDTDDSPDALAQATIWLDQAVAGLRQAGQKNYIPLGLLARVACFRLRGAIGEMDGYNKAHADLDEAFHIATRGEMRLYLADCHLESARLSLATGDGASARTARETAKVMIQEMGYHRRDGELQEIARQLGEED